MHGPGQLGCLGAHTLQRFDAMADLLTLPTFDHGEIFRVVVESPRGSTSKFKYDKDYGVIALSRPLPAGLSYPHDWGFVPSTLAPDGDPLDAIIA